MVRAVAAALVCALFVLAAPTTAPVAEAGDYDFEDFTVRTSGWQGHGVGSVIHRRTTRDMKMAQMPGGGQKMVTEVKETLKQITPTEYVIQVETKGMMGTQVTERREPKVTRIDLEKAKVVDAGEEKITIGNAEYVCRKKTIADMDAFLDAMSAGMKGRGGQTMPVGTGAVWVHATHGVLKTRTTMSMMGQSLTITMEATDLSRSETVGGTRYDCREWTMTMGGMGGKRVMLQTPKIPGMTVRSTHTMSRQGFSMESREEIVAYVKKPVTPVTGAGKPPAKAPAKPPAKADGGTKPGK